MVRRAFIQHHQKKLLSALKIMNSKLEIIGVEDGNVVYIYNGFSYLNNSLNCTVQSISSLRKVSVEILPRKHHITRVLAMLLFLVRFQMEPWPPYVIYYNSIIYTSQEEILG